MDNPFKNLSLQTSLLAVGMLGAGLSQVDAQARRDPYQFQPQPTPPSGQTVQPQTQPNAGNDMQPVQPDSRSAPKQNRFRPRNPQQANPTQRQPDNQTPFYQTQPGYQQDQRVYPQNQSSYPQNQSGYQQNYQAPYSPYNGQQPYYGVRPNPYDPYQRNFRTNPFRQPRITLFSRQPVEGTASNDSTSQNIVSADIGVYNINVPFYGENHTVASGSAMVIFGGNRAGRENWLHLYAGTEALVDYQGHSYSSKNQYSFSYQYQIINKQVQWDAELGVLARRAIFNNHMMVQAKACASIAPYFNEFYTMAAKSEVSIAAKLGKQSNLSVCVAMQNNLARVTEINPLTKQEQHADRLIQAFKVGLRVDIISPHSHLNNRMNNFRQNNNWDQRNNNFQPNPYNNYNQPNYNNYNNQRPRP